MSQDVPMQRCPNCNEEMGAVTYLGPGDPMPEPGNLTICSQCGTLLEFGEDLALSLKDLTALPHSVQLTIRIAQEALFEIRAKHATAGNA
jgi:hypothetical protein